ncbi:DUF1697 domain-containing protein [Sphingomonas ginkgonis]|uniref:DUF1697 domain-containing protein n=1 Tax=Sphingomonas ginkgonis TaxID=2315330 RepID=A0A3R9YHC8_9SPHN|nr:DUF1697 domain-containing protein [Sphingomonas ginkgonis]RST29964.1 DUF1697 domain-containing protein [Sphingomonas ginkgonis]
MTGWAALLRAVNVGGTGKLPMAELKALADELGLSAARTFIASGNLVFADGRDADELRALLDQALRDRFGLSTAVHLRTAAELRAIVGRNPFADAPGNTTVAIFLDRPPSAVDLDRVSGQGVERLALGPREIYVAYGPGMGRSRLRIPAAATGTARNMNSVARLAAMAEELR